MVFKQNSGYWILCLFLIIAVGLRILNYLGGILSSFHPSYPNYIIHNGQSFGTKGLFSHTISTQKQLTTLPNPNYISRKPVENTFYNCFTLLYFFKKKKLHCICK